MNTTIKQSVKNTFDRVGIDYQTLQKRTGTETVSNWLSGQTCETSPLIAHCILWVYATTQAMESGRSKVNISDFDRVRYFILSADSNAYSTCID